MPIRRQRISVLALVPLKACLTIDERPALRAHEQRAQAPDLVARHNSCAPGGECRARVFDGEGVLPAGGRFQEALGADAEAGGQLVDELDVKLHIPERNQKAWARSAAFGLRTEATVYGHGLRA